MKKLTVELDENEVLVKFTIDKESMEDFLGRTIELTDYVYNIGCENRDEDTNKMIADAMIEDSIYTALNSSVVRSTYSVLSSPIISQKYINGEYQSILDSYIGSKVERIVNGFFDK